MPSPPRITWCTSSSCRSFCIHWKTSHAIHLLTKFVYLQPHDFGVPNSRLRYYLTAKLPPLKFAVSDPPPLPGVWGSIPCPHLNHLSRPPAGRLARHVTLNLLLHLAPSIVSQRFRSSFLMSIQPMTLLSWSVILSPVLWRHASCSKLVLAGRP